VQNKNPANLEEGSLYHQTWTNDKKWVVCHTEEVNLLGEYASGPLAIKHVMHAMHLSRRMNLT